MANGEGKSFLAHFSAVFSLPGALDAAGPSVSSSIKGLCLHVALRNKIKMVWKCPRLFDPGRPPAGPTSSRS